MEGSLTSFGDGDGAGSEDGLHVLFGGEGRLEENAVLGSLRGSTAGRPNKILQVVIDSWNFDTSRVWRAVSRLLSHLHARCLHPQHTNTCIDELLVFPPR